MATLHPDAGIFAAWGDATSSGSLGLGERVCAGPSTLGAISELDAVPQNGDERGEYVPIIGR